MTSVALLSAIAERIEKAAEETPMYQQVYLEDAWDLPLQYLLYQTEVGEEAENWEWTRQTVQTLWEYHTQSVRDWRKTVYKVPATEAAEFARQLAARITSGELARELADQAAQAMETVVSKAETNSAAEKDVNGLLEQIRRAAAGLRSEPLSESAWDAAHYAAHVDSYSWLCRVSEELTQLMAKMEKAVEKGDKVRAAAYN